MEKYLEAREAKGKIEGLQNGAVIVVGERFPPLKVLAEQQVRKVEDYERIKLLIKEIAATSDEHFAWVMLSLIAA